MRVAGAERADDEVVHRRRVLDDVEMAAGPALEADLGDRRGAVGEQPLAEGRVGPGAGDDLGAALRPDLLGVDLDPGIDRRGSSRPFSTSRLSSAFTRSAGSAGRWLCSSRWIAPIRPE